jgi:hypothetical protein
MCYLLFISYESKVNKIISKTKPLWLLCKHNDYNHAMYIHHNHKKKIQEKTIQTTRAIACFYEL